MRCKHIATLTQEPYIQEPHIKACSLFLVAAFLTLFSSMIEAETITAENSYKDIDTKTLQNLIKGQENLVLIDVRLPSEIATQGGTIDGGYRNYNITRGLLEFEISRYIVDKNTPLVMICNNAMRSSLASKTLAELGYNNVYNYADGFLSWLDQGLPVRLSDEYPGSMLFRKPVKVTDGIWSAIGATAPPGYENSGHNNNLSFIITDEGVVVMNAGDNYLLAQALHSEIKSLTDQPVKFVILENAQGHAMLGSSYWQEQGARIIAHEDADQEIAAHGYDVLERMQNRMRDKAMSTQLTRPDITFTDQYIIELGSERIEVINPGPAHSPGDVVAWLPKRKLVIAGDIAFHQRLLPVFEHTDTQGWLDTWKNFAALNAEIIIPGHGEPTTIREVEKYTYGYLSYMRDSVTEILDEDGTLQDAYGIDQSAYSHLDTFDELAKINAGRIFRAMEFE